MSTEILNPTKSQRMNFKIGVPEKINISNRYVEFNRSNAIRDVYDALVELITNCDDSYHRLFRDKKRNDDGGAILIEMKEQRKGQPSFMVIKDKAEGMTLEVMDKKLKMMGERTSEEGDRGFMARGLRDCTELGNITVESIVDDKYYRCEITRNLEYIPRNNGDRVNDLLRKKLGIEKRNGTVISIELSPNVRVPRIDTLVRDLSWHFALRDILSEKSQTKVALRDLNKDDSKLEKVMWGQPDADLVHNEKFIIPEYPLAECRFVLWKAPEMLDDSKGERFRKSGIIVKGERAIHECSLLTNGFEKDDLAKKYFGRLECPFIDKLLLEYDDRRKRNQSHPIDNPSLLVDPNRQNGLRSDHPFTQALFKIPSEIMKKFLEQDKKSIKKQNQEIANKETKERLSALAKAAGKFMSEHIDDVEETNTGDPDNDTLTTKGLILIPARFSIAVGEIKSLSLYVSERINENKKNQKILFSSSDENALSILDTSCVLSEHPTKKDRRWCRIRVEGKKVRKSVVITALTSNFTKAESFCNVLDHAIDEHQFSQPLEFEHKKYSVKEGNKKTIKIFAKYPEVITTEKQIQISSSDTESLVIRGSCTLEPILNSNYAMGEIVLQARRLKNEPIILTAKMDSLETSCKIKIVQNEEPNVNLEIQIVNEPFGLYRAMWGDNDGKPNLLKISSQHDSIKRYLGPEPEFVGQNSLHFRALLAEIVAESVCRKTLEREARERSFRWADQRDDYIIAFNVMAELQRRLREFTTIAHKVMLKDSEIDN